MRFQDLTPFKKSFDLLLYFFKDIFPDPSFEDIEFEDEAIPLNPNLYLSESDSSDSDSSDSTDTDSDSATSEALSTSFEEEEEEFWAPSAKRMRYC